MSWESNKREVRILFNDDILQRNYMKSLRHVEFVIYNTLTVILLLINNTKGARISLINTHA